MALVDMKLPKKSKKEMKTECMPCETSGQDRWPYGLQIRFQKEQVVKIPVLAGLRVGDTVNIQGVGSVTFIRVSEKQNGKEDHDVEVQIEKIDVVPVKKAGKMTNDEFRKWRDEGGGKG